MARRQYFTVDEALFKLLAEEDDFLFGNGDSDSSGEDREEDVRQAQNLATPHSADRQAVLEESAVSSGEEGPASHFLDEQVDAGTAGGLSV